MVQDSFRTTDVMELVPRTAPETSNALCSSLKASGSEQPVFQHSVPNLSTTTVKKTKGTPQANHLLSHPQSSTGSQEWADSLQKTLIEKVSLPQSTYSHGQK